MTNSQNTVESMVEQARLELSPEHVEKLKNDLARGIYEPDVIALRYGLRDETGLRRYLIAHPWVITEAKAMKALFDSGQATAERIEVKSQTAYEDGGIPAMYSIVTNPLAAPRDRIEAAKEMRLSGRIGVVSKDGAVAGTQFSLTIHMPSGSKEIHTTVVEQAAALEADE
jgi:hypothetical protein